MAALFDGLRDREGDITISNYIILQRVIVPYKLFRDSVCFCPSIVYLFHNYEIKVISMCDSSATQIDQVIAAW